MYILEEWLFFFLLFFLQHPFFLVHFSDKDLLIQNIYGQLQQQTEFIKYHYQSKFINEFDILIDNNDRGLKGIITDSEDNVWFYHNTNTSSIIIEFNPINKTFTKYKYINNLILLTPIKRTPSYSII